MDIDPAITEILPESELPWDSVWIDLGGEG